MPWLLNNICPVGFIQQSCKLFWDFEEAHYSSNNNRLCSSKYFDYAWEYTWVCFPWKGDRGWPLPSDYLKQTTPMSDYVHWHSRKTVRSWAESSLHRRVISEPFCESLQVFRRSAARMHFWSSCLKIWGKLGWKNSHMILQPLEYFCLSNAKSNMTWQPYKIKNSPLTDRAMRHRDG